MFKKIDFSKDIDEIICDMEDNKDIAHKVRKEINDAKEIFNLNDSIKNTDESIDAIDDNTDGYLENNLEVDREFEDRIEYFLSEMMQLEYDFDEEELFSILSFYTDTEVIIRLCAESVKEINEIEQLIYEDNLSKNDLDECKKIIAHENRKIEILKKVLECNENNQDNKNDEKNEIILVPTFNDKIRIISDLEGIVSEYYPTFYELVNSAIDGTFKGVKVFINNNALASICELRKGKTRILFKRLSGRKYALIDAFIKKTTLDNGYLDFLKTKISSYWEMHNKLKELINDEKFINENKKNVEKLFQLLSNGEKSNEQDDINELKKVKK